MKRNLTLLLSLFLCLGLLAGCGETQATEPTVHQLAAERIALSTSVEELQEVSQLIVVFTPESKENKVEYSDDGNPKSGYTETVGTVSQVLKGDAAAGDSLTITEEYYTVNDGADLWTQGGYQPMNIGESYLLFLSGYNEAHPYYGMYFPTDLEYGKYVLPASEGESISLDAETLEVSYNGSLLLSDDASWEETYAEWFQEVQALYPALYG